jgi:hypothetical protein
MFSKIENTPSIDIAKAKVAYIGAKITEKIRKQKMLCKNISF